MLNVLILLKDVQMPSMTSCINTNVIPFNFGPKLPNFLRSMG